MHRKYLKHPKLLSIRLIVFQTNYMFEQVLKWDLTQKNTSYDVHRALRMSSGLCFP